MTKMTFVDVQAAYKRHTERAVLVVVDGEEIWVPRSTLSFRCDRELEDLSNGTEFTLKVDKWKAKELGLD